MTTNINLNIGWGNQGYNAFNQPPQQNFQQAQPQPTYPGQNQGYVPPQQPYPGQVYAPPHKTIQMLPQLLSIIKGKEIM